MALLVSVVCVGSVVSSSGWWGPILRKKKKKQEKKKDKRGWQEVQLSISTIYDGMTPEFLLRDDSGVIERDDWHL
jgi:plastocyanin domain-containing protein